MKTKINNLIGVIGDLHMKDFLSYGDYVSDGRVAEKQAVLDFIVESFKDCPTIVFMGDNFNQRNNSSETNRAFVEFVERFGKKEIYIISGNHEKKGNSSTAIDFLGEVKKKNWHIITGWTEQYDIGGLKVAFIPYMLDSELGVEDHDSATKVIMKQLASGDIVFAHHSISGTTFNGIKTDLLREVVLPKEKLEKKFKLVVAGHIHDPQQVGQTLITGSVFTSEIGETEKFVWIINDDLSIEKLKVPNRGIYKLNWSDDSEKIFGGIPANSIVKCIVDKKGTDIELVRETLKRFDASLIIEDYPNMRKKAHIEEGAFDFSIEALLKLYAKEKDVDYQKLLNGLQIING